MSKPQTNFWEEAKHEVAREHGYIDWQHMLLAFRLFDDVERERYTERAYLEVASNIFDRIPT